MPAIMFALRQRPSSLASAAVPSVSSVITFVSDDSLSGYTSNFNCGAATFELQNICLFEHSLYSRKGWNGEDGVQTSGKD